MHCYLHRASNTRSKACQQQAKHASSKQSMSAASKAYQQQLGYSIRPYLHRAPSNERQLCQQQVKHVSSYLHRASSNACQQLVKLVLPVQPYLRCRF
jgi:hypothetical protein